MCGLLGSGAGSGAPSTGTAPPQSSRRCDGTVQRQTGRPLLPLPRYKPFLSMTRFPGRDASAHEHAARESARQSGRQESNCTTGTVGGPTQRTQPATAAAKTSGGHRRPSGAPVMTPAQEINSSARPDSLRDDGRC